MQVFAKFFDHNYRVAWSKIEETKNLNQIKHNAVREILKYMKINKGLGFIMMAVYLLVAGWALAHVL